MSALAEKRRRFRVLHEEGCFVMPNPWDIGTARYLQHLGFPALATTSAGAAFSMGLPDAAVPRDVMLEHIGEVAAASDVPVSADFQDGYGDGPDEVAANVRLCVATGVAGLSIEDATHDGGDPLYALDRAVARLQAARAAVDELGGDAVLTARAECFVVGRPDLQDAIRRLEAYADAGADCLFAPGLQDAEQITVVVRAVAPKPVNVLANPALGLSVAELAALGVRRISVGSGLARTAWAAFIQGALGLAAGRFDGLAGAVPGAELNRFFGADRPRRP